MKISQIIFLGLALFLTVKNTNGNPISNCGLGAGVNPCSCSDFIVRPSKQLRPVKYAEPYVIREAVTLKATPVQSGGCGSLNQPRQISGPSVHDLLKPSCGPVAPKFRPIGDLCASCKSRITEVTPAFPGRPNCSCNKQASERNEEPAPSCVYSSGNPELATFEDDGLSFDEQESIYNSQCSPAVPADAVSLSLAFGLSRQSSRNVPEGSLAFGPTRKPIDGSIRKSVVDIPEERLLIIDRPVVELKAAPVASYSASYAEILAQQEALEQQRIELEAAQESGAQASSFISYKDLGYGPVAPKNPNFSTVSTQGGIQTVDTADESACGPLGPTIPGYVSGNVIVRSDPNEDNDGDYNNYGDDSFEPDPYSSYSSEEVEPCNYSSGLLARLRASARAQSGCGCGCGQ